MVFATVKGCGPPLMTRRASSTPIPRPHLPTVLVALEGCLCHTFPGGRIAGGVEMWLAVFVILVASGVAALAYLIGRRRTMPPQPNEFEQERRKHEHHVPPPPVPPGC